MMPSAYSDQIIVHFTWGIDWVYILEMAVVVKISPPSEDW